ncbi:hypothetical protein GDO86_016605 [Hymenochirus boettgeri]|uniref:Sodium channel modifier 1 n=1 Tax=Hymenochirus boettgeri TaxID=247094 RepID=A0A8T2K5S0_9PIPI|nr:hypothetical protein GDO86_016605 [Hymenochirus boettgeri]
MSFKREGNDISQLNVLKKRRVEDLLASYIPEDEALLMRNGRYACTVCHHRPVFDTIDMLSVHRSGKKHLAGLQRYYGKKGEHENELQKRRHFEFVRKEETGEKPSPGPAPLLAQTRRITQRALLKSAPYNSCCSHKPRIYSKKETNPPPELSTASGLNLSHSLQPGLTADMESSINHTTKGSHTTRCIHSHPDPGLQSIPQPKSSSQHKKKGGTKAQNDCIDPEREKTMEHYLRLKSSGWIPDGTGKWVKDENVEFDSDEEEPPSL